MARFRRAALGLLVFGATVAAGAAAPTGFRLSGGREPGSLVITNHGPAQVTIARAIAVEWRNGANWKPVETEFNAVASCPWMRPRARTLAAAPTSSVSLPPGGSLRVAPWLGYTCLGQCETACAANIYLGPGAFRFVATVQPGGARVTGPAFALPAERSGDMMRKMLGSIRSQRGR